MSDIDRERLGAWRLFLETHARVLDVLENELNEDEDLQLSWYDVLVQLSEAPDRRLRMQELADAVLLSKSGLTRLVDRMEKAGLVQREACTDDRRGTYAVLTDRGLERLEDAFPAHARGVQEHFTGHLSPDEARVMTAAFRRVLDALDS